MSALRRWFHGTVSTLRVTWRADRVVLVIAIVLVGLVTAGMVAGQRAVARAEAESLEQALRDAPSFSRTLRIAIADTFHPSADPTAGQRLAVEEAAALVDPQLLAVYTEPRLVNDTPTFLARSIDGEPPATPTKVVLRAHQDLHEHLTLVDGRLPTLADQTVGDRTIQVLVTPETADRLGWEIGTEIVLSANVDDPLFLGFDRLPEPITLQVGAIAELDPPDDDFWANDPRLHRPIVDDTNVGAEFTVYVAIDEDQLPLVLNGLGGHSPLRVEQRLDLDDDGIDMSNVDDVAAAVAATEASTSATAGFGAPAVNIGLGPTLAEEASRRTAARDSLLLAAVGLGAAAIGACVQLQRAAAERRRTWWAQARSRGASTGAMLTAALTSFGAAVTAAVAAGIGLGWLLVPDAPGSLRLGLPLLFLVATIAVSAGVQLAEIRAVDDTTARRTTSRWTRAAAIITVVVAAASVVSLRRRGLRAGGDAIDPLVALPIVMVPLAIGVLVVVAVTALTRGRSIGHLDRGVGRVVGWRRAAELRSAPSIVAAIALATTVSATATVLAWSLGTSTTGPLPDVTRAAYVGTAVAAWLLVVGVAAVATILTMRRRRTDAGILAAIGAPRREFRVAIAAEMIPLLALSILTGGVGALIVLAALSGRLDLDALTGLGSPGTLTTVGGTVLVMATSLLAVVGIVRLSAGWVERRTASGGRDETRAAPT